MTGRIIVMLFAVCAAPTFARAVPDPHQAADAAADLSVRETAWLADASRTEREGWIVLRLKGEPEAIGFQRGYLTAREIDALRADLIRKTRATRGGTGASSSARRRCSSTAGSRASTCARWRAARPGRARPASRSPTTRSPPRHAVVRPGALQHAC